MALLRSRPAQPRETWWGPFRWDPWREIQALRHEIQAINDRIARQSLARELAVLVFTPEMDLYDAGDVFVARLDLPGVREQDLDISVEGRVLAIRGQRAVEASKADVYLCFERHAGRFARVVALPEGVDIERVKATLRGGVLEVVLPKSKTTTARKVTVVADERG